MHVIDFDKQLFVARACGVHGEVITNDGYDGAQILSLRSRELVARIPFPPEAAGFAIAEWIVDRAGRRSIVFDTNETPARALELDHDALTARVVRVPAEMGIPSGSGWDEGHLQVGTYDGLVWGLHDGSLVLEPPAPGAARWIEAVSATIPDFSSKFDFDVDLPSGLAFVRGPDSAIIGSVTIPAARATLVAGDPLVISVTGYEDHLWVTHERRITHHVGRQSTPFFEAPEDEYLLGARCVVHGSARALLVLSSNQSNTRGRVRVVDPVG